MNTSTKINLRSVFHNPIHFLAFGFGSGLLPKMPGTWGTVAAIPLYLLIAHYSLWIYVSITFLLIIFAVYASHITARDLGIHDYPGIVIDEIVGFLLTMVAIPVDWLWITMGFILFRVFDIWKPWPIRWVDRHLKGGLGIVVDDLLAAIYAWLILQFFLYVWTFYQ